ncbi:MAG: hypothetical protein GQ570_12565 [Helicobacteraceae bacterium]|nr:hypothetical protein [Helicobacteraceae bacterium]
MGVVFESTIKMGENNEWYIELKDTVDARVEICISLEEYSEKVEELGKDYGGNIDEVKWLKDDNVPPHVMDEIREGMSKIQADIEEKSGKPIDLKK